MSNALKAKIRQRGDFYDPIAEGILNLYAAADAVRTHMDRLFAVYGITSGQYNVLRILRGAGSEGHPRVEIASRMVERAPDVTRIVDRLERQDLVLRQRSSEDRRLSFTKISQKGLDLLERIEPDVIKAGAEVGERLSADEWNSLTRICEEVYAFESRSTT